MGKHYIKDIGEVEYIDSTSKCCLCVSCIICGESVPLTELEEMSSSHGHYIFKVCDECKKAVMKMREMK